MRDKISTPVCLLIGAAVVMAMVGYYFWGSEQEPVVNGSLTTKRGVVTGIFYTDESPSAVVGCKIVHQGDTIDGAKVVGIDRSEVEFEKGGEKWRQKVQEAPKSAWTKTDKP